MVRIAMVFSPSMSWNPDRIRNDPERMEQTLNSESAYFLRFVQLRLATWLEDRSSSQFCRIPHMACWGPSQRVQGELINRFGKGLVGKCLPSTIGFMCCRIFEQGMGFIPGQLVCTRCPRCQCNLPAAIASWAVLNLIGCPCGHSSW